MDHHNYETLDQSKDSFKTVQYVNIRVSNIKNKKGGILLKVVVLIET